MPLKVETEKQNGEVSRPGSEEVPVLLFTSKMVGKDVRENWLQNIDLNLWGPGELECRLPRWLYLVQFVDLDSWNVIGNVFCCFVVCSNRLVPCPLNASVACILMIIPTGGMMYGSLLMHTEFEKLPIYTPTQGPCIRYIRIHKVHIHCLNCLTTE